MMKDKQNNRIKEENKKLLFLKSNKRKKKRVCLECKKLYKYFLKKKKKYMYEMYSKRQCFLNNKMSHKKVISGAFKQHIFRYFCTVGKLFTHSLNVNLITRM